MSSLSQIALPIKSHRSSAPACLAGSGQRQRQQDAGGGPCSSSNSHVDSPPSPLDSRRVSGAEQGRTSSASYAGPVRERSPALPPSSPPSAAAPEHGTAVDQHSPRPNPAAAAERLLSPEAARPPAPRTPASARSRPQDTSSEYYTAAWGSPYDFSPSSRSALTALSEQVPSEDLGSSPRGPDFGLEHLVPSRLGDLGLPHAATSHPRVFAANARREQPDPDLTPRSRTKRWIQLPRKDEEEEESEKSHWWSDGSAQNSASESRSKRRRRRTPGSNQKRALGHRSRESNLTLDQQTFWDKLREHQPQDMSSLYASRWAATPPAEEEPAAPTTQKETSSGLTTSRWADTPSPTEQNKNPLESGLSKSRWADTPSPVEEAKKDGEGAERMVNDVNESDVKPSDEKSGGNQNKTQVDVASETSKETTEEKQGSSGAKDSLGASTTQKQPSEAQVDGAQESPAKQTPEVLVNEPVKRVAEKSEAVNMVPSTPTQSRLDAPRLRRKVTWRGKACVIQIPNIDYGSLGLRPISVDEAQSRVKKFEDEGYDTSGFDMGDEVDVDDGPVHVKPVYPDETEIRLSGQQKPKVQMPDLKKWTAYTDWLTEQKLAALGVSLGEEEPAAAAATGSGAQDMSRHSSGQYPPLPFSPPLSTNSANSSGRPGMARGHSHTMSMASPISPLNGPFGHAHRHSTFTGGFPFQQQPQQPQNSGMRTFSPLGQQQAQQSQHQFPGMQQTQFGIPGFNRTGSPAHLGAFRNDVGAARGPGSPLSQQVQSQPALEYNKPRMSQLTNPYEAQNANNASTSHLPELPEEDDEEELQEKSESEPEVEKEPAPEPPAYVPPHKRAQLNANIAVPTPRGHRKNISEGLERDIIEAEKRREDERQNWIEVEEESEEPPTTDDNSQYEKKPLAAKSLAERDPLSMDLPVQESPRTHKKTGSRFVPASSFKFNPGASFEPSSTAFTFGAPGPKPNDQVSFGGHNRQVSSGGGAFNVAAPEFKPLGVPKTDFNFSSSFKADAPAFQPPNKEQPAEEQPSIFGKVEIPDIVKPARRSKAVAIVKPDESTHKSVSPTEFEDEEGRLAQSDDRLKRQRKTGDDGDQVPQFAEPTPMPAPSDFILKSQPDEQPAQRDEPQKPSEALEDIITPPDSSKSADPDAPSYRRHKLSSSLSALAKPFAPSLPSDTEKMSGHNVRPSYGSISGSEDGELEDDHPPTSPPLLLPSDEDERSTSPPREVPPSFERPASSRVDEVAYAEPSFDEIDAVMRQLNEDDTDQGTKDIEEVANISRLPSPGAHPMDGVTYLPEWHRSDAPSPSPKRQQLPYNVQPDSTQQDSSFTIHDRTDSGERAMDGWPDINRLNKNEELPNSDWSGFFSAHDEEKLQQRGQFFDSHIDNLIGTVVEKRLQPLEESLRAIQNTVVTRRPISRDTLPKRSSSRVESDADDEDEMSEEQRQRPISRGRDKRVDQIKIAVLEALREQSPRRPQQSSQDIQELHSVLADMKMSFARAASAGLELEDIRAVVEEVTSKQSQALVPAAAGDGQMEIVHRQEISELERRLNETLAGSLEEANKRRAVEKREVESKRMLRLAEEELQLLRDSNRDDDSRLHAAVHDREEALRRAEKAEDAKREMEDQVKNLEAENAASYATLEEYRMSSSKWRQDIDQATSEKEEMENTISSLERELEESQEMGSSMRRRLDKLHSDIATASGQLASEKASWKAKEEEYRSRCEHLEDQHTTYLHERERLQDEVRTLRSTTTDSTESKLAMDQLKTSHSSLEEMVRKLQMDLTEQQSLAARVEREYNDAREAARAEVERNRMATGMEIESANHQVNVVRMELESELSKVRSQLENATMEAETAKARHERLLDEEDTARREALRKVNHANSVALDEARQKHETALEELQLSHGRALQHALEDKQRAEHFMNERLALSDEKAQHYQDRVLHLQERLEVAKSAAQAAAMSAKSKGVPAAAPAATTSTSAIPEKISPQALRESILVLQEQLQERESRIDKLQTQVDQEGPAERKKRDDEIAWLRELLGVRSEELTDLVNTLAQPTFDRNTVRDTAIRIRASLQMEQQEKERHGSQTLPGQAIASLSSFATPKAAQLSSAFNKWRSNMESSALKNAPRHGRPRSSTPSKPPVSSSSTMPLGYAAGLMTPPASNLRDTPSPEVTGSLPPPRLHARAEEKPKDVTMSEPPNKPHSRQPSAASEAPLFRSQSYDQDAEDNHVGEENFEEDEDLEIEDNQPPAFRSLEAELEDEDGTS